MITINNKNYRELPTHIAEKYIIHNNQIWVETSEPKSIRERYEIKNNVKLNKNQKVVQFANGSMVIK